MEKITDIEVEIRKAAKAKKILIGSKQTEKAIHGNKAKSVVLPQGGFCNDLLTKYARLSGVNIVSYNGDIHKLGILCGRQHAINALVILK